MARRPVSRGGEECFTPRLPDVACSSAVGAARNATRSTTWQALSNLRTPLNVRAFRLLSDRAWYPPESDVPYSAGDDGGRRRPRPLPLCLPNSRVHDVPTREEVKMPRRRGLKASCTAGDGVRRHRGTRRIDDPALLAPPSAIEDAISRCAEGRVGPARTTCDRIRDRRVGRTVTSATLSESHPQLVGGRWPKEVQRRSCFHAHSYAALASRKWPGPTGAASNDRALEQFGMAQENATEVHGRGTRDEFRGSARVPGQRRHRAPPEELRTAWSIIRSMATPIGVGFLKRLCGSPTAS